MLFLRLSFFTVLFLTSMTQAQDKNEFDILYEKSGKYKSQVDSVLRILPDNQEKGIREYLSVIGVHASNGANIGINNFNAKLLKKNKCFQNLTAEFYADIVIKGKNIQSIPLKSKLNGFQSVADTTSGSYPPGWFWDLALKYADGDKNLAFHLIGICGHDDTAQMPEGEGMEFSNKSSKKNFVDEDGELMYCPSGRNYNAMFAQGSLGAETNLSSTLKNKLVNVQAPTLGAQYLPAKYYHTIGAAYTSCFLYKSGVPQFVVKKIILGAINGYRAGAICEQFKQGFYSDIPMNQSFEGLVKLIPEIKNNHSKCAGGNVKEDVCQFYKFWNSMQEVYSNVPEEIRMKKIKRAIVRNRAQQLFRKSGAYKIAGECEGMQLTSAVRDYFSKNGTGGNSNPCPKEMNKNDCKEARDVMATWAMDFEWSEEQHLKGMEFAKKNCPKLEEGQDPLRNSCKALEKAINISPLPASLKPAQSTSGTK